MKRPLVDSAIYEFVFRGQLTEVALDAAGRVRRFQDLDSVDEIAAALSLELLDAEEVTASRGMAVVYTAIAAFEMSVRRYVKRVLVDAYGEDWWEKGVSQNIRRFAEARREDEEKTRWHGVRGEDLLSYTELGHLPQIIQQNWQQFEPMVRRIDWATAIFGTLERSRNVIMHSGVLAMPDVERVGMNMRDWIKQVGV
ncbi:Swt1 family HEPN domain-containing protein [Cellulomonas uda]|uniref:Swt1-like HEPN domain-containing protein n=1 Tax=Cellulomonas uda TaxID=1714 RepID=A0A4Y3K5S9_CELUD|nr:Swt1 family HEPN domain-containing protein [Cellulomonas uda]NII67418.1 hypothetical protein [Cellulomonas uda]GEA79861.1 hypothetical protein CUD01_03050 [Cellulomonas uda]